MLPGGAARTGRFRINKQEFAATTSEFDGTFRVVVGLLRFVVIGSAIAALVLGALAIARFDSGFFTPSATIGSLTVEEDVTARTLVVASNLTAVQDSCLGDAKARTLVVAETLDVSQADVIEAPVHVVLDADGSLPPNFAYQTLRGSGALTMTVPADTSEYLYKEYIVYAATPFMHTIELSNNMTWDGVHPVALFNGGPGAVLEFKVVSPTLLKLTSACGVFVCATNVTNCVEARVSRETVDALAQAVSDTMAALGGIAETSFGELAAQVIEMSSLAVGVPFVASSGNPTFGTWTPGAGDSSFVITEPGLYTIGFQMSASHTGPSGIRVFLTNIDVDGTLVGRSQDITNPLVNGSYSRALLARVELDAGSLPATVTFQFGIGGVVSQWASSPPTYVWVTKLR